MFVIILATLAMLSVLTDGTLFQVYNYFFGGGGGGEVGEGGWEATGEWPATVCVFYLSIFYLFFVNYGKNNRCLEPNSFHQTLNEWIFLIIEDESNWLLRNSLNTQNCIVDQNLIWPNEQ